MALTAFAVPAPAAAAPTYVSLTFDDGSADQYAVRPILARHGVHGTFYVNSAKVGSGSWYMTWDQLQGLAADGNEIGGHTLSHAKLPALTEPDKRRQVCDDRAALTARGFVVTSFAYPNGAYDAATQQVVRECGYENARRTGGIASLGWCPTCTTLAETLPPRDTFATRTPEGGSAEMDLAFMQASVTRAEQSGGGWVQLVMHKVCTGCDGWAPVSPATLDAFLSWIALRKDSGTVVRSVREVLDTTAPAAAIAAGPASSTNDRQPSFAFGSEPGARFECRIDDAHFAPCSSPHRAPVALADGAHAFEVVAIDLAGNRQAAPARHEFTVETAAPATTIASGASGATRERQPSFAFGANDGDARFDCRFDDAPFAPCTSPHAPAASLADGAHAFEVVAIDALGNREATPARRTFSVDTTAPTMPRPAWAGTRVREHSTRVLLTVGPPNEHATGRLVLTTNERLAADMPAGSALGTASFTAQPGRTTSAVVTLTSRAHSLLRRRNRIDATAAITLRDALGNEDVTRYGLSLRD